MKNSMRATIGALGLSTVAATLALSAGAASAFDAGLLASITSGTLTASGDNLGWLQVKAPAPCSPLATRHVLKVLTVVPKNASDQAEADKWAGDNLYAPVGVGLPGPLTVENSSSWQQKADAEGQKIVPGKYNLELRCQNNLGNSIYEQWRGSITFTSPTAFTVNPLVTPTPTPTTTTPRPTTTSPRPTTTSPRPTTTSPRPTTTSPRPTTTTPRPTTTGATTTPVSTTPPNQSTPAPTPTGTLADTGSNTLLLGAVGGGLVAGGAGLLVALRRRRGAGTN